MNLKKYHLPLVIFLFLIMVLFFFNSTIWWDSAVYVGMGKYIYSLGEAGLWEPSRPILWPLILGLSWSLGLDPVISGKVLTLLFGIGIIIFTYLVSRKVFDENIALLSAFLLAFTPAFVFFSSKVLSTIPSLFFILVSIYFFLDKKYFLTGIFSGLAFLSRFLELFVFLVICLLFLIHLRKERNYLFNFFYLLLGFFIVLIPYLIINYSFYGSILYPFGLQIFMTQNTGFIYHETFIYYFVNLFLQNPLFILALIGIVILFLKRKLESDIFLFSFLILFIFFTLIDHKEVRFIIIFLPFLVILTSYSVLFLLSKIDNKRIENAFLGILLLITLIFSINGSIYNYSPSNERFEFFWDHSIEGSVWISNPVHLIYSDSKVENLMYYPTFNHIKYIELRDNIHEAENVLLNSCDLYCEPNNVFCGADKATLINLFRDEFELVKYNKKEECESFIFRK